ncbi:proline-specific peptidase [Mycena floridula]|nr:proline-specific peptidase [Mycena floridula]
MSLTDTPSVEGYLDWDYPLAGKPCQTWYKIIGDLAAGRPLVALHGGPGVNHAYFLILAELTKAHSIPLVLYDQIGNANSTHFPEKQGDEEFFCETLFLAELDNVLSGLKIRDNYDLLGHSWGSMVAAQHAVMQPRGLKHLILASPISDITLLNDAQKARRQQLPQALQDVMDQHEAAGTTNSPEWSAAMNEYFGNFLCRLKPMPDPILEGFGWLGKDTTVTTTIYGTNQFVVAGSMKKYRVVDEVHKINVPTLLVNGRFDFVQDSVVEPFFRNIPRVKWVVFADSAHMAHHEEAKRFMEIVGAFLTK